MLVLDEALRLLDHHLGDLHVAAGGLIERARHDFAAHGALHLGDFFRPLVDEQHDQVAPRDDSRVIEVAMFCSSIVLPAFGGETIRPRWPLPIGAIEVDDARGEVFGAAVAALELEPLLREERRQVLEQDLAAASSPASRS